MHDAVMAGIDAYAPSEVDAVPATVAAAVRERPEPGTDGDREADWTDADEQELAVAALGAGRSGLHPLQALRRSL